MATFSQAVQQFLKPNEDKKIFLHNKKIAYIDYVPQKLRNAEILDLHRNQITKLHNITQFGCLQNINLSNNNIADVSEIFNLTKFWKSLQQINLSGNRICDHKLFSSAMLILIPNLKFLNGLPINQTFLNQINSVLPTLQKGLNRLLQNYLDLLVLHQIYQRDQVNKECLESFNFEKSQKKNIELQLKQASLYYS